MKRLWGSALLLLVLAAPAFAYVVKLKDGSMLFARMKYEVKGKKAIITLENGTVTQIDLEKLDVPGTDEYNAKYSGNVIAIDTPEDKKANGGPTTLPPPRLQDLVKQSKHAPSSAAVAPAPGAAPKAGDSSWQPVDSVVQATFARVFDGAAISQWRVMDYRGKTRLLVTTNNEEAVFNALSAAARALADLAERGKTTTLEIVLTASSNEPGGAFEMTAEQARQLVNGGITVGDYFVRNVIL